MSRRMLDITRGIRLLGLKNAKHVKRLTNRSFSRFLRSINLSLTILLIQRRTLRPLILERTLSALPAAAAFKKDVSLSLFPFRTAGLSETGPRSLLRY